LIIFFSHFAISLIFHWLLSIFLSMPLFIII
jgi:hypothetical protein